jgi:FkbM family methyltransferase
LINPARRVASRVPRHAVTWLGTAQFRYPVTGRLLRWIARRVASGEGTIGRGPAAGLRIDATGRNAGYVLGTSDLDEQRFIASRLDEGDVFWDLGANIGFFTILAARLVGAKGQVLAFEPLPENAQQLRRNVELNGFRNVTVEQVAVGAKTGTSTLALREGRRDAARLTDDRDGRSAVSVSVISLDDYFAAHHRRPPTLVKIDVEGAEIDAILGGLNTIRSSLPTLLVEVHWLGERFVSLVENELGPLGYGPQRLNGDPFGPLPTAPERFHLILSCGSR